MGPQGDKSHDLFERFFAPHASPFFWLNRHCQCSFDVAAAHRGRGRIIGSGSPMKRPSGWVSKELLRKNFINFNTSMVRRRKLCAIGGFDEQLRCAEDYDLWLRIAKDHPIGLMDETLIVKTGGHDDQLSRQYWGMDRFRVDALERLLDKDLKPWQRKLVIKEIVKKLEILYIGREKRTELPNVFEPKLKQYKRMLHESG
ncbi:hypothetical protein, partial [Marivita sp.]|uniref:hypothetical protein n=1 Tax=Marivita sp. TaxID=2003365 RepID=UPI0025B89DBA